MPMIFKSYLLLDTQDVKKKTKIKPYSKCIPNTHFKHYTHHTKYANQYPAILKMKVK